MRITLAEQIREAETHRNAIEAAAATKPELLPRLHSSEGIVLTLRLLETTEPDFREFMRTRYPTPSTEEETR